MKKIIPFLLFNLAIVYSNAQTGNPDSIRLQLQNDKNDTSRVLHLADLSFEYLESNPDTTMKLALEALSLSRKIGFLKGEAVSLNRVGNAYDILGNYPKSLEYFLKALQINEKIRNEDGIGRNTNNIGLMYFRQEDYRIALTYFFRSRDLGEKLLQQSKDEAEIVATKKILSVTLSNIGNTYSEIKLFDSARTFIHQAFEVGNSIRYFRTMGIAHSILGEIYTATEEYPLALEYFRSSIPNLQKAGNHFTLCDTYLGMAKLFEKTRQNDSALFYAKRSLSIAQEKKFTLQVRDAGRYLTAFYRGRQMPDSALFYVDITKLANDSLFSQQKNRQFQSLGFDEDLRQSEIALAALKEKEERNHNLQYAAIAIGLISFIILFFLLSHSIVVKTRFISFLAVMGLLAVFEFINLFVHPYLSKWTNDSPVWMLIILMAIGALLVPVHHRLERWITRRMVEKNKKIRLAAAKKTIANLETDVN